MNPPSPNSLTDRFDGQVVLITGAGRGLGRALALAFAARGARVAVDDLTPVNLDGTVAQIEAAGGTVRAHLFDIAKKMPAQALVETVLEDWGRVDVLINNAGVHPRAPLLTLDEWDWQRVLEVNLFAPFYLTQAVGRVMTAQGGGVILNIGSAEAAGLADPSAPVEPASAAFLASKTGLLGLTRAAAQELAPAGVRVNLLCPAAELEPAVEQALYLCGPRAASITGQVCLPNAVHPLEKEQGQ